MHPVLQIGPHVRCLPVVHGSGDFAVEVRRVLLTEQFDCVAVPLPSSFQRRVEAGIAQLPNISIAIQEETNPYDDYEFSEEEEPRREGSYVPIDPCQPVIAALRLAEQEHIPRAFIDLEVERFTSYTLPLPDSYALKQVPIEQFAAAILPTIPAPPAGQPRERVEFMAARLRELSARCRSILLVCSILEWPWIRDAFLNSRQPPAAEPVVDEPSLYGVDPSTLLFLLGELPFITGRYEEARFHLDDDENLSVDGIKELLLAAREKYRQELKGRGRRLTPQLLRLCLKYIRNLCLIERRMTPDLYTLIVAGRQLAGDQFAICLAEAARDYPFRDSLPWGEMKMSIDRGELPDGGLIHLKNRLPGPPVTWRSLRLNRRPPEIDRQSWSMRWNPFSHCSWPPEDVAIERFRTHVKDRALSIMGNDLARIEKFTTSLKDGLDIRETLRNWHTGDLYVKEMPPSRGSLDAVLMLFDSPADPRDYPWRITWHAEHHDESTLSFFATHFQEELVGPGIAQATYGGALFLFPPRPVRDVWHDSQFDWADTLEERLLAAGCHHARERHIAILSQAPPGVVWKRLAKRFGKVLVHVPLAHFSQETVQQLRMFHVLNGHHVRSYAEHFIRKA